MRQDQQKITEKSFVIQIFDEINFKLRIKNKITILKY